MLKVYGRVCVCGTNACACLPCNIIVAAAIPHRLPPKRRALINVAEVIRKQAKIRTTTKTKTEHRSTRTIGEN